MIVFAAFLPGLGPIPIDLGWILQRKSRDVTGLAGNRGEVGVDTLVLMFLVDMALLARNLFLGINGVVVCNHAAQDLMTPGLVAGCTLHIEVAAHMHVIVFRREVQAFV